MYKIWKLSEAISDQDGRVWRGWLYCKSKNSRNRSSVKTTKKDGGGVRLSERAMQARTGVGIGVGSSLALREATNHSEKARGTRVYGAWGWNGAAGGIGQGLCPASKYGGLILGATRRPGGVPWFVEPTGAAQGLQVRFWLQRVDLPEK